MNQDVVWAIIRYGLIALGSWTTSKGWTTDDQITTLVGAVGTLFIAAWGIYVKYGTRSVPEATAQRVDVPTVSAATGAVVK